MLCVVVDVCPLSVAGCLWISSHLVWLDDCGRLSTLCGLTIVDAYPLSVTEDHQASLVELKKFILQG